MERNFSIDAMKTVSTFMVCFIHFNGFSKKCIEWWSGLEGSISYAFLTLCSCAVPIFLIINGYLIINNGYDFKVYIQKGLRSFILATAWIFVLMLFLISFFKKVEHGRRLDTIFIMDYTMGNI